MPIDLDTLTPRERVVLSAARWATLTYHSDFSTEEAAHHAASAADAATDGRQYPELVDLAGSIIHHLTDPERLAVERIQDAIQNLTGLRRTIAAYRANAGVLLPGDVERIANP